MRKTLIVIPIAFSALALAACGTTVTERAATGALGGAAVGGAVSGDLSGAVAGPNRPPASGQFEIQKRAGPLSGPALPLSDRKCGGPQP